MINLIRRMTDSSLRLVNGANLTFGLREAVVLSLLGIAIATAVAYHYAG